MLGLLHTVMRNYSANIFKQERDMLKFRFECYNYAGKRTMLWEGLARGMSDYTDKYSLVLFNRHADTARVVAEVGCSCDIAEKAWSAVR